MKPGKLAAIFVLLMLIIALAGYFNSPFHTGGFNPFEGVVDEVVQRLFSEDDVITTNTPDKEAPQGDALIIGGGCSNFILENDTIKCVSTTGTIDN
ncbi:hypothetical protein [Candidatus Electronema sp. PJ]|uniref:hypothetical protein n=1 Tax=Candidatus Electronema sp. PJ TaxID=3401572 RepID=UPI003AA862AF